MCDTLKDNRALKKDIVIDSMEKDLDALEMLHQLAELQDFSDNI